AFQGRVVEPVSRRAGHIAQAKPPCSASVAFAHGTPWCATCACREGDAVPGFIWRVLIVEDDYFIANDLAAGFEAAEPRYRRSGLLWAANRWSARYADWFFPGSCATDAIRSGFIATGARCSCGGRGGRDRHVDGAMHTVGRQLIGRRGVQMLGQRAFDQHAPIPGALRAMVRAGHPQARFTPIDAQATLTAGAGRHVPADRKPPFWASKHPVFQGIRR
uniref:hypothetical protein n=1 Tax=Paracoccus sp. SSK6 TaxID=3143131 RepID=UPI00321B3947